MNRTELESAIQQLEQHRGTLPEEVIDTSIRALRAQLDSLNRKQESNERLHATVLFIDLAGFTAWSEKLDPEVVTETLNRLWTVLDGIVIESGGVVDKHIGDCLMALWGVDTVREDNAEQAVKAALMMHERLGLFCIQENITLRARIGVHTGPILWGSIGSNAEQTAMGDAVNLASRLEHACPIGKVLISGDTYRLVKGVFDVTPQEPLSVKGKESPIKTYLVERTKPRAFRSGVRGLDSGETPFTGRAEESRLLKGFFHAVVHNDKKIMTTIEGEAGIGKSRLLREFEDWTELQTDVYYIFRGRCDQSFENRPWSLLKDILTFRFEIPEAGSPNEIINALQDGLSKIWIPETAKEAVPWLAALVGWTNGSKLTADPQILANKAIEYFYDLIAYLCYVHPVVFFLEDIHWADHGSLGIFETLMDSPNQKAVLIVANSRPDLFERHPTWGKDRIWHKKLKLKPLGEPELLQILDVLLDNTGWNQDSIKKQIADSTAGNPFFVEEMVQCLKDQGTVLIEKLALPSTLATVLDSRLSRLTARERRLLQQASVFGQTFWDTGLAALEGNAWDDEDWEKLRSKDLILRRDAGSIPGAREWIFRHALIQKATEETVLLCDRKKWHIEAALWFETQRIQDCAAQAAPHWEAGGNLEKASYAYRKAGNDSFTRYSNESAAYLFNKALAWQGWQPGERIEIALFLAKSLENLSQFDQMREAINSVEQLARNLGGDYFYNWAFQYLDTVRYFSDWSRADEVWNSVQNNPITEAYYRVAIQYTYILIRQRRGKEAQTTFEEIEKARPFIDPLIEAEYLFRKALYHLNITHNYTEAEQLFLRACDTAEAQGELLIELKIAGNLMGDLGDFKTIQHTYWPRIELLYQKTKENQYYITAKNNYGLTLIKYGLAEKGIECLHQVIPVFSFYDSNKLIVFYNIAIGQWVTGLTDSARTTISEWQKLVDMFNSDLDRAIILSVKGRLFAYEKKYSEAATALQDAINMFQEQEETYYLIEAEAWLSLALYKMGEEQKASNLAHSVHQRLEQGENLGDLEFPYSITYCLVEVFRDREPDLAHRIAHIATEGINMFTVKLDDAEAEKGYTEYFFHKALLNFH